MTNQAELTQVDSREVVMPSEEPTLTKEQLQESIEAILYAAGHPLTYSCLAKTLNMEEGVMRETVAEYATLYNHSPYPRGIMLLTMDDACQLCTKQEYISYIRDALGIRRSGNLSVSSMETLAIVAYNQPVTRAYIDTIRGVDSSYAVSSLIDRGLLEGKGRLDAPGRPMLYGTTRDFLRCFGLHSLAELPGISGTDAAEMLLRAGTMTTMDVEGSLGDTEEGTDAEVSNEAFTAEEAVSDTEGETT